MEGDRRLTAKIERIKADFGKGILIPFIEFGTRRRCSLSW